MTEDDQQAYIKRILRKRSISKISFGSEDNHNQQDLIMKAMNDANRKAKIVLDKINFKIRKI